MPYATAVVDPPRATRSTRVCILPATGGGWDICLEREDGPVVTAHAADWHRAERCRALLLRRLQMPDAPAALTRRMS